MAVDQTTGRRTRKLGLTAHDPSRACPGYTLYTPMFGDGTVYLLDMDGKEVHRWKLPHPPGDYAYVLPNGNLFYLAKTPDGMDGMFPAWQLFKGGALLEVDWNGAIVWEHRDPTHHHDGRRTEAGGAVYLAIEELPAEVVRQVRGGFESPRGDGRMWADRVVEVDANGAPVWEWRSWEHLDFEKDVITATDLRDEWTHSNTVVPLPGGDLIVSMRNISMVGRVDRRSGEFVWKLTPPLFTQQHDPSVLPNGNVLIFNNGARRPGPLIFSSVLEVTPESGRVVWEYRDRSSLFNFFSSYISGAQRLPNGNTLICEGLPGRIFEVTPEYDVVWEYVNPHFFPAPIFGENNAVFRAFRYPMDVFPRLT